jgi:hypothetical protein
MNVYDAICTSFNPKPEPCKDYIIRPTELKKEGIPWYDVILIIIGIISINAILYYCIRRCVIKRLNDRINVDQNDLSGQINSVIDSYFSLKDMTKKNLNEDDDDDDEDDDEITFNKKSNKPKIETFDNKNEDNKKEEEENTGSKLILSNSIKNDNIDNKNKENDKKGDDDEEKEKEKEKNEE